MTKNPQLLPYFVIVPLLIQNWNLTLSQPAMVQRWPVRSWGSLFERARHQAQRLERAAQRSDGALLFLRSRTDLEALLQTRANGGAVAGGLIGIGYWDGAVCDATPSGVARSIAYAVKLVGVGHVALGSDYDGATEVWFDTSELAALTQALLDEGLSEEDISAVMGGNQVRFFLRYLP